MSVNYGEKIYGWIAVNLEDYWHESHGTDPLEAVEQSPCCFDSKEKAAANAAAYFKLSEEAEKFLAERDGIQLCETREGTHVMTMSISIMEMTLARGTAK